MDLNMKNNNAINMELDDDKILSLRFRDISHGLKKAKIPPGASFKARDVIPALDKEGKELPYKKYFYYNSRLWVMYKLNKSNSACWYFRGRVNKEEYKRNCGSSKLNYAIDHAITNWLDEPDEKKRYKNRSREEYLPKLQELIEAIETIKPESTVTQSHAQKGLRCVKTLAEALYPGQSFDKIAVEALFTPHLFQRYRDFRVGLVLPDAIKEHGKDSNECKRVRIRATNAAAKMVKMAKGALWDIDGSLKTRLDDHGLKLNWLKLDDFKKQAVSGASANQRQYKAPSDKCIKTTFREIQKYASMEKCDLDRYWVRLPTYKSSKKDLLKIHVYLLFWGIVGSGCRLKEMCNQSLADIVEIDGKLNFTGIGKNGDEYQIPIIDEAAEKITPWLEKLPDKYLLGKTYSYRYEIVGNELRKLMRKWGWDTVNLLHELRAYTGFKIFTQVSPIAAQQYMRHASIKITEKFYVGRYMTRKAVSVKLS